MNTIKSSFFEAIIRLSRFQDNGTEKKVNEVYVIEADTFTEAEIRITQYASADNIEVRKLSKSPFNEVFHSGNREKYYKVKVCFLTIDDKSGREKRQGVTYLVGAYNTEDAQRIIFSEFSKSMTDYTIQVLTETKIIDIVWRE